MGIIIDGYNLLHAAGIVSGGIGPGSLERARAALLNFLAAAIDPEQLGQTTVVFDAKDAPPGLPRRTMHRGIAVHYAADYEDADALIEQLIRADAAPRRLTVVSSDHRVQRAARRRKAVAVDSDRWYAQVVRDRWLRQRRSQPLDEKPPAPLSAEEVQYWLDQFGGPAARNDQRG